MSTNTTNMAMGKGVDGDNAKTYLETTLGAALDKIDAHDHSGTTHGIAVPYGSIGAVAATTFTPTLTQSASPTLSTAAGRYIQIGKIVIAWVSLTTTGSGTAANGIVIGGLPVGIRGLDGNVGSGTFQRTSLNYNLTATQATSTSVNLWSGAAATGQFGVNPAVTIASGDQFYMQFVYEAV